MNGVSLSIDKIAITMTIPNRYNNRFDNRFYKFLRAISEGCSEIKKNELYEHSYKYGSILIQWGGLYDSGFSSSSFRMEWNPSGEYDSKFLACVFSVMGEIKLRGSTITRIDTAIDYGCPINPLLFYDSNKRKGCIYYEKGYGVLTHYIGSLSSSVKFRIYNKAVERLQNVGTAVNGDWWRVEAQDTRGYYYEQSVKNPFGKLKRTKQGKESIDGLVYCQRYRPLNGYDYFFWYFVEHYGLQSALSYLDKDQRYKMKKKLIHDESIQSPYYVFDKYFNVHYNAFKGQLLDWSRNMNQSTDELLRDCGILV